MAERYGPGGYVIFPGDNGYGCCGGDVDRFDNQRYDEWMRHKFDEMIRQHDKDQQNGSNPASDTSPVADSPTS